MKKAISLLLALVLCLSLCACGGGNDTPETTAPSTTTESPTSEPAPTEPAVPRLNLGETASTNLIDFTLLNADLTIYASATSNSTYLSPVDDKTMYGASIGKILMIPAFTMTNKDRAGSMSVCGGDWYFNWKIGYEGTEYPVFGFDLNFDNSAVKMTPGCIIDPLTEYNTEKHDSSNYLLYAGETVSMRIVTVANFEPANLTDGFELRISLPNASGELEDFIYEIPDANAPLEESQQTYIYDKVSQLIEQEEYYAALENLALLGDYKDSAELYDFCMRRYAAKVGMWNIAEEYLIENMDSFTQITGDTLKEIIPGNSWYLQGVGSNGWKYLEDGTIDDGWGNDRGWSVEGDLLVIRTKNNYTKVSVLELYDGGYVLLENGEYYATLYKVEND